MGVKGFVSRRQYLQTGLLDRSDSAYLATDIAIERNLFARRPCLGHHHSWEVGLRAQRLGRTVERGVRYLSCQ